MFEQLEQARARKLPRYALLSIGAHVALVLFIGVLALRHPEEPVKPPPEIKFIGPGKGSGPPPPPPPKGTKTPQHKKTTPKKVEIPTKVEIPKTPVPIVEKKEEPQKPDEPEGESFGVKGGVIGGVKDGVLNGVVGGTGGGGDAGVPEEKKPPKNVPAFVIARDAIQSPPPHMPEVYRITHKGAGKMSGSYKVCVGPDGHVYDVTPIVSIPGADASFIEQIEADWLYKPQTAARCFIYSASVDIQ